MNYLALLNLLLEPIFPNPYPTHLTNIEIVEWLHYY